MPSLPPWKTKALPLDMNLSLRYSCTDAWSKEGAPRDSSRRRRRRWSDIETEEKKQRSEEREGES